MSSTNAEQPAVAELKTPSSDEKDHEASADSNGGLPGGSPKNDVSKRKDDVKQANAHEDEGLVSDSLRSPMQTRVRRISAELRLSASSNLDQLRKAGKGLCSAAHKLPLPAMPKSLRRRSWHYEEVEDQESSLLMGPAEPPAGAQQAEAAALADKTRSKSSENLVGKAARAEEKTSVDSPARGSGSGDRSFLARKWEARKNRDSHQESRGGDDEKMMSEKKVESFPSGPDEDESADNHVEPLCVDAIPVVFEPLVLDQRVVTPTVTICVDDQSPPHKNTNPFWDCE